ncbi:uncharacterized protein [Periplaneta americana]|uniref:uncharacterized protein n=1 Tax=Periplaneta americana TaxID=6978 RepID=UPI0037E907DC
MEGRQRLSFTKTSGFADGAGQEYEIKVSALLFMRALQQTKQFLIATNLGGAGAFDDVVIVYKANNTEKWKTCFVQLKHKTSKKPITIRNLIDVKGSKGDFKLIKYCKSYTEIKARYQNCKGDDPVFSGDFNDSEYVIFTNAKLDDNLSSRLKESYCTAQKLLEPKKDIGSVFSFSETVDKDICQYFEDVMRLKELLDSLDFKTVSEEELENKIKHFKMSLSNKLSKTLNSVLRIEELQQVQTELNEMADFGEFLRKLSLFVEQPTEEDLDAIIEREIHEYFRTNDDDTKAIWRDLYEGILQWWKKGNYFLTEAESLWQKIIQKRIYVLSKERRKKMENLGVNFQKYYLLSLPNTPEINIVTKSTLLTCLKVCETMEKPHIVIGLKTLLRLREEVMALWPSKWCTTLVVDWEFVKEDVNIPHSKQPESRLIIVSKVPIKRGYFLTDETVFSHFNALSQYTIGLKEIVLQGFEVTLNSLLTEKRECSMNEDVTLEILTTTDITVGKNLGIEIDNLIPRTLKHHIYVKSSILNRGELSGILAVSGIPKEDVPRMTPRRDVCIVEHDSDNSCKCVAVNVSNYGRILTNYKENDHNLDTEREVDPNFCQFTLIRNSQDFSLLCERHQNVHWIELQKDKDFVWKGSQGDFSLIQEYIDSKEGVYYNQDQMITISDRVILITAGAGMGKSTLVTQLCCLIKSIFPSKWVIPVLLNDYTHILDKHIHKEMSMEFIKELLSFAADVNNTQIGKFLLETAMDDMGNIVVLLDGVDEISPNYTNTVCALIRSMAEVGISQIWITSRPIVKDLLEKELRILSYTLLPFSVDDQLSYLENYLSANNSDIDIDVIKEFTKQLLQLTIENLLDGDSQFMGIPLQARMMAESFEHHLKAFKDTDNAGLPEKINLIELFKQFMKAKFDIFVKQKMKSDPTNVAMKSTYEKHNIEFQEIHTTCSLAVLVPEPLKSTIRPKEVWKKLEDILERIETGNLNTGILNGIVNNKPCFIHHSFGEYFFAVWLMNNYKENKKFLRKYLCQPELQIMLRMMNYMISENCDLHMAVLINDINKVRKLLKAEIFVDQQDKYGRTALHLASFYNHRDIAQELLKSGADMDITDYLRYDALDYCDRNKSWGTADLLLKHSKDLKKSWLTRRKDKLVLLDQNITDPNYGLNALLVSAEEGYEELARYLRRNGLDLKNTVLNPRKQTALHIAVMNEKFGIVDIVLDKDSNGRICQLKSMFRQFLPYNVKAGHMSSNTSLKSVPSHGNLSLVQNLVEGGVSPDKIDANGYTLFHKAALEGDLPVVQYLTKQGVSINSLENNGHTPLYVAAAKGHCEVVEYLLQQKYTRYQCSTEETSPLHAAAYMGHMPVIEVLLQYGIFIDEISHSGLTALHAAIMKGRLSVVEYLLKNHARINMCNKEGQTALYIAAREGHLDIVQCLLNHHADINIADKYGNNPLHIAAFKGHLGVVEYIVEKEVLPSSVHLNNATLLRAKAFRDHLSIVEYLLQRNSEVNKRKTYQETSSPARPREDYSPIVGYLLGYGESINITEKDHNPPLHAAVFDRHLSIGKPSLEVETLLTIADSQGNTALHLAARKGHLCVCEYLLEHHVKIDARNKNGETALYLAAREGHLSVVQCLLSCGANFNITDKNGHTPLKISAFKGHLDTVKLLILKEVLLSNANSNDQFPLHVLILRNSEFVIEWLL